VKDCNDWVGAPGRTWANEEGMSDPGEREGIWASCYRVAVSIVYWWCLCCQEEARLVASERLQRGPSHFEKVGYRPQCVVTYKNCTVYDSCLVIER
jgi:hypothetical protein